MNPIYSLMESPHRWLILAALSIATGSIGAMAMIAYTWPEWIARGWFYLGLLLTVMFLAGAFVEWQRSTADEADNSPRPR